MKKIAAAFVFLALNAFPGLTGNNMQVERSVLTQDYVNRVKKTLVIDRPYTLMGTEITLPKGVTIKFKGGSISDGTLIGNSNSISMVQDAPAFETSLKITGDWHVPEIYDSWFAFVADSSFVSNGIISNILALASDMEHNHIYFTADRTYYYELPYKGRADLGDVISKTKTKTGYKRNYVDLFSEKFSYLRIFTIPSNTHLTISNQWRMMPTNQGAYFVFWEYGKQNVTVDGNGAIYGEVRNHIYNQLFNGDSKNYYGEWGVIFRCIKCKDFEFKDITLGESFGDCLMFQGSYIENEIGSRYADGLIMQNVKIVSARRNGVAIGARNVRISGCHFENCGTADVNGTLPKSAIDFEPDGIAKYPELYCSDVVMDNCTFSNNFIDVNSFKNVITDMDGYSVTISNCVFTSKLSVNRSSKMKFVNCTIPLFSAGEKSPSIFTNSTGFLFENCTFGKLYKKGYTQRIADGNTFKNCVIKKWE